MEGTGRPAEGQPGGMGPEPSATTSQNAEQSEIRPVFSTAPALGDLQGFVRKSKSSLTSWGTGLTMLAILCATLYYLDDRWERPSADLWREYGIVGNVTDAFSKQAPTGVSAPLLVGTLRLMTRRNKESQTAALRGGAADASINMLEADVAQWSHMQALLLLQELMRDNPAVKDAVLKQGGVGAVVKFIKEDKSESLTAQAAQLLAVFAADNSASRKKGAANAGAVAALVEYLKGGTLTHGRSYVNAAHALANLAAHASSVQALLIELGGPELITTLLSQGPKQRITQPAVYASANLAAGNQAAQDALHDAGAVEALVKLVTAGVEGHRSKASEPFHTEILELLAEMQRNDPAVRAALAEVGGLEELLGIIEAAAEIKPTETDRSKQLVAVEEGEGEDDELHSIRRLVRDLQDEVDSEASSLPEVKVPTLGRGPSGARILQKVKAASRQNLASTAAWALSNMVANNQANQDRARECGAVDVLVKLLESAEDSFVARGALSAISSLVKGNAANKVAVRKAHGVEGLVKLLASNPADKEVLQATAHALKFMTAERPVYEVLQRSSSRWLRVMGRQAAAFLSPLSERLVGVPVSPALVSTAMLSAAVGGLLLACIWAASGGVRAGSKERRRSQA